MRQRPAGPTARACLSINKLQEPPKIGYPWAHGYARYPNGSNWLPNGRCYHFWGVRTAYIYLPPMVITGTT